MTTRKPKQPKRPTAKARVSAMGPDATIVEVTAPNGQGALINLHMSSDGLFIVRVYRADKKVVLDVGKHTSQCAIFHGGDMCDCGAWHVYDPNTCAWTPTSKTPPELITEYRAVVRQAVDVEEREVTP